MKALAVVCLLFAVVAPQVWGHGMLLDPPNRSSMWRYGYPTPPNYDDNQLYCGGIHQDEAVSTCGICGDPLSQPRPRENENGGKYGTGIIPKTYQEGGIVPVFVKLTANHYGYFIFSICNLDVSGEEESCFRTVPLEDGQTKYTVPRVGPGNFTYNLRLPQGIRCNHCVLRWQYRGGNSWGSCDDGTEGEGCGIQETFRSCSDIAVGNGLFDTKSSGQVDVDVKNGIAYIKNIVTEYKTKQKLFHSTQSEIILADIKNEILDLVNEIEDK